MPSDNTLYDTLYASRTNAGNLYRSFLRFDLPQMPKGSVISEAILYLAGDGTEGDTHYLTASLITQDWRHKGEEGQGSALSWTTAPAYSEVLDYTANGGSFNITKAVRKWKSGAAANYGIAITAYDETRVKRETLRLRNSASAPYLTVTYRTMEGVESYYSTHAFCAGTAGTGCINDYTGALTLVTGAVATAGERMPLNISHVYNLTDTEHTNGWHINYEEHIRMPLDTAGLQTYPYVHTDEDGTKHYYKKQAVSYLCNGVAKEVGTTAAIPPARDEDGLNLYIVPVTQAPLKDTYPLKLINKSAGLVKYFDTDGCLGMITDSNQFENGKNQSSKAQNSVTIQYENAGAAYPATAYTDAQTAATLFDLVCKNSSTAIGSTQYLNALELIELRVEKLKTDPYATVDYEVAKQVNCCPAN